VRPRNRPNLSDSSTPGNIGQEWAGGKGHVATGRARRLPHPAGAEAREVAVLAGPGRWGRNEVAGADAGRAGKDVDAGGVELRIGSKISNMPLNGTPISDTATHRVTANECVAGRGGNFTVFRSGTNKVVGPNDLDALVAYFQANSPVAEPAPNRIAVQP